MKRWRHAEIAEMLGSLRIKGSAGFFEKPSEWTCPSCLRSKAQIVAPGRSFDIQAMVHRHHDHIEKLVQNLFSRLWPFKLDHAEERQRWHQALDQILRRFCRFEDTDLCGACNAVDPAAKKIISAPWWFSFSPHGIANMIVRPPTPYALKHEIDRHRLDLIWDKVSGEIDGLESRIGRAIEEARDERVTDDVRSA